MRRDVRAKNILLKTFRSEDDVGPETCGGYSLCWGRLVSRLGRGEPEWATGRASGRGGRHMGDGAGAV